MEERHDPLGGGRRLAALRLYGRAIIPPVMGNGTPVVAG
jgi:hypothetical protein